MSSSSTLITRTSLSQNFYIKEPTSCRVRGGGGEGGKFIYVKFQPCLINVLCLHFVSLSTKQCCGSGSVSGSGLDPNSLGSLDLYPDLGVINLPENRKQLINFIF